MAVNKEFFPTRTVTFFKRRKLTVKFLCGRNVDVINGTFAIEQYKSKMPPL